MNTKISDEHRSLLVEAARKYKNLDTELGILCGQKYCAIGCTYVFIKDHSLIPKGEIMIVAKKAAAAVVKLKNLRVRLSKETGYDLMLLRSITLPILEGN